MKILELNNITRDYFGHEEISRVLGITPAAARVSAHRYVQNKVLIRAKRDFYILSEKWKYFSREKKFEIANLLQVPSYVSLLTALDFYQITTQMQPAFIESIALKRTREIRIDGDVFNYCKMNQDLYYGFSKQNNYFIATPEKAFLDACYLASLGRYNFDGSAIDLSQFDQSRLAREVQHFPDKTRNFMAKHGYFSAT